MTYKCTEAGGRERTIVLAPGITEQDLLTLLCWHYEAAARFVLDWVSADAAAAVPFTAGFIAHVVHDLHIFSPPMVPKCRDKPGLQTPGTSVCSWAFQAFCELLQEDRELVCRIRESPAYSTVEKETDILGQRGSNWISLTRGISWEASPAFKNPNPIPKEIQESFRQGLQAQHDQDEARRAREAEARAREKEVRTEERRRTGAAKQKASKEKSAQRQALRDRVMSQPVDAQLKMLATETETPITAFAFDPRRIADNALRQLDDVTLAALAERADKRWEVWWKDLAARSRRIREHRTTPPTVQ
jgi:hypothetical protein